MSLRVIIAIVLALVGSGGVAQSPSQNYLEQFVQGCSPTHTFQLRNCAVQHHYICQDGSHRMLSARQNQPVAADAMGPGWQPSLWVGLDGGGQFQVQDVIDPFSLSVLRQAGSDNSDVSGDLDLGYYKGRIRSTAHAWLTGEAVAANGETFLVGKLESALLLPKEFGRLSFEYNIYVGRDSDVMALSLARMAQNDFEETYATGLMAVLKPGMPGFLDQRGQFDCAR